MTYGKILEDYGVVIEEERTSEEVRNDQYKEIMKDITQRQMEVYWEVFKHPNGIATKRVAIILRRSLHGISGRFSEMVNAKGYDKRPYCNPPLLMKCGEELLPNDLGQMTNYSKFKVCNGFNGGQI